MKLYTLHAGTWDSHHLVGVFSTSKKANNYAEKFKITDNPKVDEIELDPHDSIISSEKVPYFISCKKSGKIRMHDDLEHFVNNNVHFSDNTMYYYLSVNKSSQAIEILEVIEMAEQMRQKFIERDWKEHFNAGEQYYKI